LKVLKAKIKKSSVHYKKGLNLKGKSLWLSILNFNAMGEYNYQIKAIRGVKNGFAEYENIWVSPDDIIIKQHEDGQLSLDIFSAQEDEENKSIPSYLDQQPIKYFLGSLPENYLRPDYVVEIK
jgi:hypothetical protein